MYRQIVEILQTPGRIKNVNYNTQCRLYTSEGVYMLFIIPRVKPSSLCLYTIYAQFLYHDIKGIDRYINVIYAWEVVMGI